MPASVKLRVRRGRGPLPRTQAIIAVVSPIPTSMLAIVCIATGTVNRKRM